MEHTALEDRVPPSQAERAGLLLKQTGRPLWANVGQVCWQPLRKRACPEARVPGLEHRPTVCSASGRAALRGPTGLGGGELMQTQSTSCGVGNKVPCL